MYQTHNLEFRQNCQLGNAMENALIIGKEHILKKKKKQNSFENNTGFQKSAVHVFVITNNRNMQIFANHEVTTFFAVE